VILQTFVKSVEDDHSTESALLSLGRELEGESCTAWVSISDEIGPIPRRERNKKKKEAQSGKLRPLGKK